MIQKNNYLSFMEAVGAEVVVAFIPIILAVTAVIYFYGRTIRITLFGNPNEERPEPVNYHPLFGEGQCSICLDERKKFQVSATCGHSFCGECLFDIYARENDKILCPLCRKQITTIFKSFRDDEGDPTQRGRITQKVYDYNDRFDDNRPWGRRILQFPYVLRRCARFLLSPLFWALFIRSYWFIKIIVVPLIYLILPVDLLPERMLGFIGFIDDLIILLFCLAVGVSIFALVYLRRQRP